MLLPFERYAWGSALTFVVMFAGVLWLDLAAEKAEVRRLLDESVALGVSCAIDTASLHSERKLRGDIGTRLDECVARWDAHTGATAALLEQSRRETAAAKADANVWRQKWETRSGNCRAALDHMGAVCASEISDY